MAGLTVDTSEIRGNPLDVLEELVDANEWRFDRNSAEEMLVELSGRWCDYRLYFIWQEDLSAISFLHRRSPGAQPSPGELPGAPGGGEREALARSFRPRGRGAGADVPPYHPLRGLGGVSVEQLEDLVNIAVTECEPLLPRLPIPALGREVAGGGGGGGDARDRRRSLSPRLCCDLAPTRLLLVGCGKMGGRHAARLARPRPGARPCRHR
jgi:hypothetical protein